MHNLLINNAPNPQPHPVLVQVSWCHQICSDSLQMNNWCNALCCSCFVLNKVTCPYKGALNTWLGVPTLLLACKQTQSLCCFLICIPLNILKWLSEAKVVETPIRLYFHPSHPPLVSSLYLISSLLVHELPSHFKYPVSGELQHFPLLSAHRSFLEGFFC